MVEETTPAKSLRIPFGNSEEFIEIFPEEISNITSSQLITVLQDENCPLALWTEAALIYMTNKRERESTTVLTTACSDLLEKQNLGNREERTRILAAAGIGYLTQANKSGSLGSISFMGSQGSNARSAQQRAATDQNEELRVLADKHFLRASKLNQFFPMTWVGRGMLNLSIGRLDQAKFFFETTLKQCGMVLPALLGMACVYFKEGDCRNSIDMYSKSITLFPHKSGAAARVGLGLSCYKQGYVDRAKAAFKRANEMDPENVEAMVGMAVLDVANADEMLTKNYKEKAENAMRLISTANLIDHSNAMVQNHLANYYFRKWTPVTGVTVSVEQGSNLVKGSGPINLDAGERIRIGYDFDTSIVDDEDEDMMDEDHTSFKAKDIWKSSSTDGLKIWKKDYDRVIALAKGAFSSTTVQGIQAESLYLLARVYHVRDDMKNANKFYERACTLAPDLSPARFGLAQTLIWDETYDEAAGHLGLVVGKSPSATDAHAALGMLKVKSGKDRADGFNCLKKAIDLDPANANLVLLEALALQQQEVDYPTSLERYTKAVELMENQGETVSWVVSTNMGVLCHETKKYDEAAKCYEKALKALHLEDSATLTSKLDSETDCVHQDDNSLFWNFVDTLVDATQDKADETGMTWNLLEECTHLKCGDHIKIGDSFNTEIIEVEGKALRLKNKFVIPASGEDAEEVEKESNFRVFVRRSNERLANASAISVAFNLARLHEATGRTVAAVELHKAIVKRHPSYVNSYLRLACIARDCGSLTACSQWLESACAVAPGNPEVLTLVGNLHLSLCDWQPAQQLFNQLLEKKIPNVEAYSMLCLGNIYFNNLKAEKRYTKNLQYAADFYRRILNKDNANAFAANGIGTVMAEKGDLPRAKEIFNRVREISDDSIPDAVLNLGHINLALSKHPEALQMYHSYMDRTSGSDAPTSSKSQEEDEAEVLLYIGFTYFDWARQTEALNNANAAPADGRYKKCIGFLEEALTKTSRENIIIRYNWCMAKLAAANCVLQKLTRGIRRTAEEVEVALNGLEESLPKVQAMLQWKEEGKKVPVSSALMNTFVAQCQANIESAKSHLSEERKKEDEARELRELQQMEALEKQKLKEHADLLEQEEKAKKSEEIESKARMKMEKVNTLLEGWETDAQVAQREQEAKKAKRGGKVHITPQAEEDNANLTNNLFDDSSGEEDNNEADESRKEASESQPKQTEKDLFGDDDESDDEGGDSKEKIDAVAPAPSPATATASSNNDLFGDSSEDDSDEEPVQANKRASSEIDDGESGTQKKRKVEKEDDS